MPESARNLAAVVFDRVVVRGADSAPDEEIDAHQFAQMPLTQRVRLLLEHRIAFFLGKAPVESRVALDSMKSPTGASRFRM